MSLACLSRALPKGVNVQLLYGRGQRRLRDVHFLRGGADAAVCLDEDQCLESG